MMHINTLPRALKQKYRKSILNHMSAFERSEVTRPKERISFLESPLISELNEIK